MRCASKDRSFAGAASNYFPEISTEARVFSHSTVNLHPLPDLS
jgi:hypothetical protein